MVRGKVQDIVDNNIDESENASITFSKNHDQCSIELTSTYNNSEASAQLNICECDSPQHDCLHNAGKHGEAEEIKYLLEKGADANCIDKYGRTALHWISAIECSCGACTDNSEECMKYFLFGSYGTNIDVQDKLGETPLHLAIKNQNIKCANLLVSLGANVALTNSRNKDVLSQMAKKTPDVMVSVMNRAITVDKLNPNHKKCVLKMDFGAVVGYPWENFSMRKHSLNNIGDVRKEMTLFTLLLCTSKASQKIILTHPLAIIFLNEKWKRVRKYFILFFSCYVFWLLSYTSYIIKVYLVSCPCEYFSKTQRTPATQEPPESLIKKDLFNMNMTNKNLSTIPTKELQRCHLQTGITFDVIFILLLTIIMVINEVIKIIISPKLYLKTKLNIANWILIIMVIITTSPIIMEPNAKPDPWQYQAAALAIFFSWAFLLSQLGSFPYLGKYVEILGHVLNNFALSMLTFSSVLVAFALSFNVLFPGEDEAFSHFFYAMLKVLVMMTGEVDYQDMFYDKENDSTKGPIVGHLLYAAFVIVVAIVLMNLLIGLTVSDIQTLQKEAEFTRTTRQILEMYQLESSVFSNKLKSKAFDVLRRSISVIRPSKKKGVDSVDRSSTEPLIENLFFRFRPNDRKDHTVPEHLKHEILKIAVRNYHVGSGSSCDATAKSSSRSLRSKNTISLTSE